MKETSMVFPGNDKSDPEGCQFTCHSHRSCDNSSRPSSWQHTLCLPEISKMPSNLAHERIRHQARPISLRTSRSTVKRDVIPDLSTHHKDPMSESAQLTSLGSFLKQSLVRNCSWGAWSLFTGLQARTC